VPRFLFLAVGMALKAHRRPVVSGHEELDRQHGQTLDHEGWREFTAKTWRISQRVPLKAGQRVRVVAMHGFDARGRTDPDAALINGG